MGNGKILGSNGDVEVFEGGPEIGNVESQLSPTFKWVSEVGSLQS